LFRRIGFEGGTACFESDDTRFAGLIRLKIVLEPTYRRFEAGILPRQFIEPCLKPKEPDQRRTATEQENKTKNGAK